MNKHSGKIIFKGNCRIEQNIISRENIYRIWVKDWLQRDQTDKVTPRFDLDVDFKEQWKQRRTADLSHNEIRFRHVDSVMSNIPVNVLTETLETDHKSLREFALEL